MINHLSWSTKREPHKRNDGTYISREKTRFTFRTNNRTIAIDAIKYLIINLQPFVVDYWGEEIVLRFSATKYDVVKMHIEKFLEYQDGKIDGEIV